MEEELKSIRDQKKELISSHETGSKEQRLGLALYRCANKNILYAKDLILFPHLLRQSKIKPKDVTPRVISIAATIDRTESDLTQQEVDVINRMFAWKDRLKSIQDGTYRPAVLSSIPLSAPPSQIAQYSINLQEQRNKPVSSLTVVSGSDKRMTVFGHPVTAVLRWMGLDGWNTEQAKRCMKAIKCNVAPETIRIQVTAGKNGSRGDPAALTEEQAIFLLKSSKKTK